jgi:hypothetical protein
VLGEAKIRIKLIGRQAVSHKPPLSCLETIECETNYPLPLFISIKKVAAAINKQSQAIAMKLNFAEFLAYLSFASLKLHSRSAEFALFDTTPGEDALGSTPRRLRRAKAIRCLTT